MFSVPSNLLQLGENVLAVELHQNDAGHADARFALWLDVSPKTIDSVLQDIPEEFWSSLPLPDSTERLLQIEAHLIRREWEKALELIDGLEPAASRELLRGIVLRDRQHDEEAMQAFNKPLHSSEMGKESSATVKAILRERTALLLDLGQTEKAAAANLRRLNIPPRSAGTPASCIDLSAFYTANLAHDVYHEQGNHFGRLTRQTAAAMELDAIPFDVRGAILVGGALKAEAYPMQSGPIPVGAHCSSIIFLHAATGVTAAMGTEIGSYLVRFENGETREVPLVFGDQIVPFESRQVALKEGATSKVAWEGLNEAIPTRGKDIQLAQFRWMNPSPDVPVEQIQLRSHGSGAGICLLAVTLQD